MGIFDSIKNALGSKEPEKDVTVGPSQLLREAGIDPTGLKFGFGTGSIAVSGEISDEADRQKILDTLSSIQGISTVEDKLVVAAQPEQAVEVPPAEPASPAAEPVEVADESPAIEMEKRSYTVKSGDSLWKISEAMYGEGSKYMKIFEANTDLLEDPDRIFPGQELVIPELDD